MSADSSSGLHNRPAANALSTDGRMAKVAPQQPLELVAVELLHVKRVPVAHHLRGIMALRARDHQESVVAQHSTNFSQHVLVTFDVLERLEAHDDVDRVVGQRNGFTGTLPELEVRPHVSGRGFGNDIGGDVDSQHVRRDGREHVRPIPLTAGDIEDALVRRQLSGDQVSVQVFETDAATNLGDVPLARPFRRLIRLGTHEGSREDSKLMTHRTARVAVARAYHGHFVLGKDQLHTALFFGRREIAEPVSIVDHWHIPAHAPLVNAPRREVRARLQDNQVPVEGR